MKPIDISKVTLPTKADDRAGFKAIIDELATSAEIDRGGLTRIELTEANIKKLKAAMMEGGKMTSAQADAQIEVLKKIAGNATTKDKLYLSVNDFVYDDCGAKYSRQTFTTDAKKTVTVTGGTTYDPSNDIDGALGDYATADATKAKAGEVKAAVIARKPKDKAEATLFTAQELAFKKNDKYQALLKSDKPDDKKKAKEIYDAVIAAKPGDEKKTAELIEEKMKPGTPDKPKEKEKVTKYTTEDQNFLTLDGAVAVLEGSDKQGSLLDKPGFIGDIFGGPDELLRAIYGNDKIDGNKEKRLARVRAFIEGNKDLYVEKDVLVTEEGKQVVKKVKVVDKQKLADFINKTLVNENTTNGRSKIKDDDDFLKFANAANDGRTDRVTVADIDARMKLLISEETAEYAKKHKFKDQNADEVKDKAASLDKLYNVSKLKVVTKTEQVDKEEPTPKLSDASLPVNGAEVAAFLKEKGKTIDQLPASSILIRALKDKSLIGCSCYSGYESDNSKFALTASTDAATNKPATIATEYSDKNTYSVDELAKAMGLNDKAKAALIARVKPKLEGGKTLTYTALMGEVIEVLRAEAKLGKEVSGLDVLKKTGVLA